MVLQKGAYEHVSLIHIIVYKCDVAALIALRLAVPVDGVWSTNSAEELLRIASMKTTSCRYDRSEHKTTKVALEVSLFLSYIHVYTCA